MIRRLDAQLVQNGFGSRKNVKRIIRSGIVLLNGKKILDPNLKVDLDVDTLTVDNKVVSKKTNIYVMLNKPAGVVTAAKDDKFRTVFDVLPEEFHSLTPVGRLDKDTEGLLLFTDNGLLVHRLTSPKRGVNKVYEVVLEAPWEDWYQEKLSEGLSLGDGYKCLPAFARPVPFERSDPNFSSKTVLLTISEGKYHQVKRMFAALGNHVVYLKRISVDNVSLDESISIGEWRFLTEEEIAGLLKTVGL